MKLSLWFIGSIVVNALLIGLVAGDWLNDRSGSPHDRRRPPMISEHAFSTAPPELRREVGHALAGAWEQAGAERENAEAARRAVHEAMQATPYDQDAVDTAFRDWRAADSALKEKVQLALSDALIEMTPEQREMVASRLLHERRGRRGPPGRRDRSPN